MVNSRVTHGSAMRNSGMCLITGSFQSSLPSWASMAMAVVVKALLIEPMPNSVPASTGGELAPSLVP